MFRTPNRDIQDNFKYCSLTRSKSDAVAASIWFINIILNCYNAKKCLFYSVHTCFGLQTDIFKIVSNTAGLMLLRPVAQALAVCLSALSFCYHRFVWRSLSSCLQSSEQDGQKRTELGNWKSEFIKNCVCFHLNVEEFVFSSNCLVSQVPLLMNLHLCSYVPILYQ